MRIVGAAGLLFMLAISNLDAAPALKLQETPALAG